MELSILLRSLLLLLITSNAWASAPARVSTYNPNSTISSIAVTNNENAIFNYLQAGVDTYADATIVNADIAPGANIQSDKLNLTSIAQSISNTGTFSNTGNVTVTGTINVSSTGVVSGGLGFTPIGNVFPSTGAFTTLKVGTTNQGDILYDNGTSLIRLTPGTTGQLLRTNGTSANPSWASVMTSYDYGTSASASTTYQGPSMKVAFGNVSVTNKSTQAITNLPFASSTSYKCTANQVAGTLSLMNGPAAVSYSSGSSATIHNAADTTFNISWICIGT